MKDNKIQKQMAKADAQRKVAYKVMYKSLQAGSILMRLQLAARIIAQYDISKAERQQIRTQVKQAKRERKQSCLKVVE